MKIAVLFGGTSEERDVSIASAAQLTKRPHLVSQRIATRLNPTKVGDFPASALRHRIPPRMTGVESP